MIKIISTLFQERGQLISKQLILARNLQSEYVTNNVQLQLRDYKSLAEIQKNIQQKERTIVELMHKKDKKMN